MLLLLAVIVGAVLVGLAAGGSFRGFDELRLRWWPLAILGLAMQVAPVPDLGGGGARIVGPGLLLGSFVVLVVFAGANVRLPGFPVVLVGLAMNLLVISVNGGMPVSEEAALRAGLPETVRVLREEQPTKHHLADEDEDVLLFLADVIPVGPPFRQVVSAGDLVLYSGVAWLVVAVMRRRRRRTSRAERLDRRSAPASSPPEAPGSTTPGSGR